MTDSSVASLGDIFQISFAPKDFDAAVKHWTTVIGAGPFYYFKDVHDLFEDRTFKGAPNTAPFSVAIGYWGDTEIELVHQTDPTPSVYNDSEYARDSVHHFGVLTPDIDLAEKTICRSGGKIVFDMVSSNGVRCFYADMGGGDGLLEMVPFVPQITESSAAIRAQAQGWDGSNPLRDISELVSLSDLVEG